MIERIKITVPVVGTAGSATGSQISNQPVNGKILRVHVAYTSQPAGTCDVTIATVETPTQDILTLTNTATSGWFAPRMPVHGPTGTALTYNGTQTVNEPFPVSGYVKVTVAQGDPHATGVVVTMEVER